MSDIARLIDGIVFRAVTHVVKHEGGAESGPYCRDCAQAMSSIVPGSHVVALPSGDRRRYAVGESNTRQRDYLTIQRRQRDSRTEDHRARP